MKFMRVFHECRENFHVSRTRRELVAKVLNMFKKLMRIFFAKNISQDCRATVLRRSCDGRATFVRVSQTCRREILANLRCEIFATLARRSRDSLENTCKNLATIWRENKTKRHLYDSRATLARMSRDCRTN